MIFLPILLVFFIDFLTKYLVTQYIPFCGKIYIAPFFNFVHVKNLGVSFSLFYNNHKIGPWILAGISLIIILFLQHLLKKTSKKSSQIALASVIGGAIGNIFDRFYYGGVVDFLDFHLFSYHWPAFNIADIAIILGIFTYWYNERK